MTIVITFLASLLFGLGLVVSGLANPAKVQNFLDVAGAWDPSLALTMAAAVMTTAAGFWLVLKRDRPIFAEIFHLPAANEIDGKLVSGSALFGIGWGLAGYCPGPAITAITLGGAPTLAFVTAMVAGMALGRYIQSRPAQQSMRA